MDPIPRNTPPGLIVISATRRSKSRGKRRKSDPPSTPEGYYGLLRHAHCTRPGILISHFNETIDPGLAKSQQDLEPVKILGDVANHISRQKGDLLQLGRQRAKRRCDGRLRRTAAPAQGVAAWQSEGL